MKKYLCLIVMLILAFTVGAQEYVDLGLPSGTQWKTENEGDVYYYGAALAEFGAAMPTYDQFVELKDGCRWEWTGNGYKVTGPNGNSINLPVTNGRDCEGNWLESLSNVGGYWTSTPLGIERGWMLSFTVNGANMGESERCFWRAVRLVKNK